MRPVSTHAKTFGELLGNGVVYRVPPFQRDYSWGPEEWEDLWFDLDELLSGNEDVHYMGYLVRQPIEDEVFDVIDGQQRLTTLTLLVLAAVRALERLAAAGHDPQPNQRRIDELRRLFVGSLDVVSLASSPKLTLNRATNTYFQNNIIPLRWPLPRRGLQEGQRQLKDAFEWLVKKVDARFEGVTDGAAIGRFVKEVAKGLFFTVIDVDSELNAFKVFETLNARGVQLSPTDLLKNRLFAIVHGQGGFEANRQIESLQRRWAQLTGALSGERFPDFLRAHWNSRHPQARKNQLFREIRARVQSPDAVFELLAALEGDVEIFAARRHPEDEIWSTHQRDAVSALDRFGVRQPWPLLLAVHRHLDQAALTQVLRACEVIAVRYNVIGRRLPSDQERTFNRVARDVSSGQVTSAAGVIRGLAAVYPSDAEFKADFAEARLLTGNGRNKRVARYLLAKLANHEAGGALNPDDRQLTLEHILPEAPPETGWDHFDDVAHANFRHRLGNYVLLEGSLNRGLGQADWATKRDALGKSALAPTQALAEWDTWTAADIRHRQQRMAKTATAVWRLPQLS